MTLNVRTDRKLVRAAGHSTRYALVTFEAPEAPAKKDRRPVNIALVLDRSGSMGGEKIRLAREAVKQALRSLRATDRFALVVYDDRIDVVVESTHATPEAVRNALERLERIDARGSTDLGGGWLAGCEQVAATASADTINRCLLLTDGLANQGITDPTELAHHAAELHTRGIVTSTFGVGADFDENLLRAMSDAGAGHFYFIERAVQIPDCLAGELGEALEVVAREAVLRVETPAGVEATPLNALRYHRAGQCTDIAVGDLVSGQEIEVVVKLTFAAGKVDETAAVRFVLSDKDDALQNAWQALVWMYADHSANDRQERDRIVDRAVAKLYAANARAQALELNRHGRFEQARHVIEATRNRILPYAGDDRELHRIADELVPEVEMLSVPMAAMDLKRMYAASYNLTRMRDVTGKARRKPKA